MEASSLPLTQLGQKHPQEENRYLVLVSAVTSHRRSRIPLRPSVQCTLTEIMGTVSTVT